jgi:DUF1680 family protein
VAFNSEGFWGRRLERLRTVTLPSQHDRMEETGRLENFRRAAGKAPQSTPFQGFVFNDSDVFKWMEAASWTLAGDPEDRGLGALLDGVVDEVLAAQQSDGYLNTCFVGDRAGERFTNIRDFHELYCAGHLIQAGIAHRRATGKDRLFEAAVRYAGLIGDVFGPGRRQEPPGHPEIEMALVELFRETGGTRWLDCARFFLDQRGHGHVGGSVYHVDHAPFTELHDIAGHAVRALYLCSGATDLLLEGAGKGLRDPIGRLWRSAFERKAYVTGGMGSDPAFEAFGEDFDLPNETAYAETCAAVAGVLWNWRLLLATGEARFADEMELALFNGALSGIGLDGCSYFYLNPLASRGDHRRQPYFDCACCPPNIARLLAMLPGLFVSTGPNEVWLHQYGPARIDLDPPPASGRPGSIRLDVTTDYPWDGEVEVAVRTAVGPSRFGLRLRVPGWAEAGSATVNGDPAGESSGGTYLALDREWRDGDKVHLSIPMPPRVVPAQPSVQANQGRVALARGPVVYCLEQADNPGRDVWDLVLDPQSPLVVEPSDLLGGIVVLGGEARVAPANQAAGRSSARFTAIPYSAWANREPGPMHVWPRRRP